MNETPLKKLYGKLKNLSSKELSELALAIQSEAQRKQNPLRRERDRVLARIQKLESQVEQEKLRLEKIQSELGEIKSATSPRIQKASKRRKGVRCSGALAGAREGSLRWHMAESAKASGFPKLFTTHELFDVIKEKVKAKSEKSLWAQFVATLSRCPEFRNVTRGRGAKRGKWRIVSE
ncbi:MAG TPA: hypothetical protein PKH07_06800 [bacterium]|nr:hypothetical protein [bacterium]